MKDAVYFKWIKNPKAIRLYEKKAIKIKGVAKLPEEIDRLKANRARYEEKNRTKILKRKARYYQKKKKHELSEKRKKYSKMTKAGWKLKYVWVKEK